MRHWTRTFAMCAALFVPRAAAAEPVRATGSGPSHDEAVVEARRSAIAEALRAADGGDATARADVQRRFLDWTRSYRVLRRNSDTGAVEVEVEVDVDIARLRKALSVTTGGEQAGSGRVPPRRARRPAQVSVHGPCGALKESVAAAASGAGEQTLHVECEAAAPILHAPVYGARVRAWIRIGSRPRDAQPDFEVAFAGSAEEALQLAADRAIAGAWSRFEAAQPPVAAVQIAAGVSTTHLFELLETLRTRVVGVSDAELRHTHSDGSVVAALATSASPTAIADALGRLQLRDGSEILAEVRDATVLVRLESPRP